MTRHPSRTIVSSRIAKNGISEKLVADEAVRSFLAQETGVLAFDAFHANVDVQPWGQAGLAVTVEVVAMVVQECVNTLEPIKSKLDFRFSRFFVQPGDPLAQRQVNGDGELVIDPEEADWPDEMENDRIDLWEIMLEELNLRIDPFAVAGAFEPAATQDVSERTGDENSASPFSKLEALLTDSERK